MFPALILLLTFEIFFDDSTATYAQNKNYSKDAFDDSKLLVIPLQINETLHLSLNNNNTKSCGPYTNKKPNFSAPGRRINEEKCLEYIWEMENRDNETLWNQKCGIKKGMDTRVPVVIQSRVIFGGRPAEPGEFPHMGAVGWLARNSSEKWVFKCGSTLISNKFLLSAAHCSNLSVKKVHDIARSKPEIVRLGVEIIAEAEFKTYGYPNDNKIKTFIVHPKYTTHETYFDISIIELEIAVKFTDKIQPACLWSKEDDKLGRKGTLTGWGYTESGEPSSQLKAALVNIFKIPECEYVLSLLHNRHWHGFADHQLCAGKMSGGIDTCQGDSGGPLQVMIPTKTKGKKYWTVAVTSFGFRCGQIRTPGIYTRVSNFIDWIEEIVWGHEKKGLTSM